MHQCSSEKGDWCFCVLAHNIVSPSLEQIKWLIIYSWCSIVISSWPSYSSTATWTVSFIAVGMFLPTKSGRIGNSRWPRSTSTASEICCGRPISIKASRAARTVRPVKRTSSTRMTCLSLISIPSEDVLTVGSLWWSGMCRSSRYKVISSAPTGISTFSSWFNRLASRSAR